uniref:Actin-interacting protein 1 n=1 Tax=Panagrellus redivivus TaxID=6233 RepID=A0A7E4VD15_PANRE
MVDTNEFTLLKTFASLPRTVRGMPFVISGDPTQSKILYCNGNNVYIRNIDDPTITEVYSEHAHLTTVAKYSPSGYYIASGDQTGKLRIWDTTQSTHILKAEYSYISGPIRDIAWNDDSKRIAICGEGRDRFGHVFLFDTGTSNGSISGHARPMSSIDFKPTRPYRIITGSEDYAVGLFEGPPFKFKTKFDKHARFVNSVRYNKDGSAFASGGADGKLFIFEGTDGETITEFHDTAVKGGAAHAGGVYALAWSPDATRIVTASGDKTVKIWNAAEKSLLKTITFGNAIEDQQLAVTWQKDTILSIGLSGFIFYINPESGEVTKTLRGHNRPITALTLSADKTYAFTADSEGHITRWLIADGSSERITPTVHKSQVSSLQVTSDGTLISTGWDDTLAFTPNVLGDISNVTSTSLPLKSQPRSLSASENGNIVVVACQRGIAVYKHQKEVSVININYEALAVAYHSSGKWAAVGGSDHKVHIYEIDDIKFTEKDHLSHAGLPTSLTFSPDGEYLVATDTNRRVIPYKVGPQFTLASEKDWTYHNARVNTGAWSPNNRYIASGGLDTNVNIWDLQKSGESPIEIKGAHSSSPINAIVWLDEKTIITAGQDSNLKIWSVKLE